MKYLSYILILFSFVLSGQTNYYFKDDGNDGLTGLSDAQAWQTEAKLESLLSSLVPGDTVSFKSNSEWKSFSIYLNDIDGSYGNEIVFTSYGTGAKPKFSGYKVAGTFTEEGGNIWSLQDSDIPSNTYHWLHIGPLVDQFLNTYTFRKINDQIYTVAKHPNDDYYYKAETVAGDPWKAYFNDNDSTWVNDYWDSAYIATSPNAWTQNFLRVTDYSSNRFNLNTSDWYPGLDLSINDSINIFSKYEIFNSLNAADVNGESVYSPTYQKLWFYYDGDLNAQTVEISITDSVLTTNECDYIKIIGLHFDGGSKYLNKNTGGSNITIENCKFTNVPLHGSISSSVDTIRYLNDSIIDGIGAGITLLGCAEANVTGLYLKRIGIYHGMGQGNENDAHALSGIVSRYRVGSLTIEKCEMDSIGSAGIVMKEQNCTNAGDVSIRWNKITNYAKILSDNAAVYIFGDTCSLVDKRIISNYAAYGDGNKEYMASGSPWTMGIPYLDGYAWNFISDSNVTEHVQLGFYLNGTRNNIIRNSIYYDNAYQTTSNNYNAGGYMSGCAWCGHDGATQDAQIYRNIFIAADTNEVGWVWNYDASFNDYGTDIDTNIYVNQWGGGDVSSTLQNWGSRVVRDLTETGTFTGGWDSESSYNLQSWTFDSTSGIEADEFIRIIYNWSDASVNYNLGAQYYDISKTEYSSIEVPAYQSVLLFYKSGTTPYEGRLKYGYPTINGVPYKYLIYPRQ